MQYIEFRIGEQNLAIKLKDNVIIEPTLINKVGPKTINTPHSELIDGLINYKGKMVDVVDISSLYKQEKLKKFDGLLFITNKDKTIALKYEGFHKESDNYKGEIIDGDELINQL